MSQQFSQERLNQLASARLAELGVTAAVGDDGRVHGELALLRHRVTNPFDGQPIASATFVVEGHDHIRFTTPALLAALRPIQFFHLADWAPLIDHVRQLLAYRKQAVDRLATHLHHFRLDPRIDAEHGAVLAGVPIDDVGDVVLLGDERGVRVSHLRPAGGGPNRPLPAAPIELAEFVDASDLTAFLEKLTARAPQMSDDFEAPKTGEYRPDPSLRGDAASAEQLMPSAASFQTSSVEAGPGEVPEGAVTVEMALRCFGEGALLSQGVAFQRTFFVKGERYRLTFKQKAGRRFIGAMVGPGDAQLWSGELDVANHPAMDEFVLHLLEARGVDVSELRPATSETEELDEPPPAPQQAPRAASAAPSPVELLPAPGELWMMSVIVERADDAEVRYYALNADGQPYGAARILPRAEFERVFAQHRGSWRLLVRVLAASPQQIAYVQLDPALQPNGETRAIAPAIFRSNFLPGNE